MSFPASPTINQTTTTNGITYVYNTSSNNVGYWTRVPTTLTLSTATGSATRSTTTSTPPAGALVGDIWYYQGTDAVYRYEFDGFTTTWIDFNGPTIILTTGSSYSFVSGSGGGGSGTATTFTTLAGLAPSTANVGDEWYDSTTDTLYRYTYDGTNRYWVDITGASGFSGGTILGAVTVANTLTVTGNTIIGTGGTSTA
jgi:hypothetical protein